VKSASLRSLVLGLVLVIGAIVVLTLRARSSDAPAPTEAPIVVEPPPAPIPVEAPPAVPAAVEPAPAKPLPAQPAPAVAKLNEPQLMTRLRAVKDKDPAAAIELAREGNRRFPDSADAPERASILIHALAALDRPSEARGEAEDMVNHYPDSNWVREIERFIGAHRRRNVRVNDAGELIAQ
jgi:type IV secretory pathway VirB10-like protein